MSYRIEKKTPALGWYAIRRDIVSREQAEYMLADIADRYQSDPEDCEVLGREASEIAVREGGDTIHYRISAPTREEWLREGDSRETSKDLMAAIWEISGDYETAVRIWEGPTSEEVRRLAEIVTDLTSCWGAAGVDWR